MEAFNEGCTAVIMYHLLGFTDINRRVEAKTIVGYSMLGFLALNVVVNLAIIFYVGISDVINKKVLE